jgi:transcriptional regulator GlxA family with amidase domain
MKLERRQFAGLMLASPMIAAGCTAQPKVSASEKKFSYLPGIRSGKPLIAPKGRKIRVGFAINPGFQVIDMAGPWETFQDTYISEDAEEAAFDVFTVSETSNAVQGTGGMTVVPNYTIENAPAPDVIVVPHFTQPQPKSRDVSGIHRWIKDSHKQATMTMSVCTGAFQLAKTGLLDGVPMTTNQRAYDNFAKYFPEMDLRRGPRFVEEDRIATSGGLSAGIDLALHVVTRYFGEEIAQQTADIMEYAGTGWRT